MSKRTKDPINYALLRKVHDLILARPRQFEMSGFFTGTLWPLGDSERDARPSHCGTACCIAGWAITLKQMPHNPMPNEVRYMPYEEADEARRVLGLTKGQANSLFYAGSWPLKYRDAYERAKTYKQRARVGATRIAAFIESKGAV